MTQKELIEFCKKNDPKFNKDAHFKVLEPFWKKNAIGITQNEWTKGFYVCVDGKEKDCEHNGKIYYFSLEEVKVACDHLYDSHYKKFFINLERLDYWGREIKRTRIVEGGKPFSINELEDLGVTVESTEEQKQKVRKFKDLIQSDFTGNPLIAVKDSENPLARYVDETLKEDTGLPVEEFPIVKESVETMTRKNHTWLLIKRREKPEEKIDFTIFDGEEPFLFQVTSQQFSDLVDLMIEARKDLLK